MRPGKITGYGRCGGTAREARSGADRADLSLALAEANVKSLCLGTDSGAACPVKLFSDGGMFSVWLFNVAATSHMWLLSA